MLSAMQFTSRGYETPGMATDGVLLHHGKVLLVQRGKEPAKGQWAIPGGFVEVGETTEQAVVREVSEETGLGTEHIDVVDLVGVYSDPHRDPRGHIVSITYLCALPDIEGTPEVTGEDDAADARWFDVDELPDLAFDHRELLQDALRLAHAHQERLET